MNILTFSKGARLLTAITILATIITVTASNAKAASDGSPYFSITVNENPQAIAVTNDGRYAYVANFNSDNLSIIDLQEKVKVKDIPTGDGPSSIAVSGDNSFLAVTNFFSNDVFFISPQTHEVKSGIQVGDSPTASALSPDAKRLFVANLMGRNISIIDTEAMRFLATISLRDYPQDLTVSADGDKLFVSLRQERAVAVIDPATNKIIKIIRTGGFPRSLAFSPDGGYLCVGDYEAGRLLFIDPGKLEIVREIKVGEGPIDIGINMDASEVFALDRKTDTLAIADIATGIVSKIPVAPAPARIGLVPGTRNILVTSSNSNRLQIIYREAVASMSVEAAPKAHEPTGETIEPGHTPRVLKEPSALENEAHSPTVEIPTGGEEAIENIKEPVSRAPTTDKLPGTPTPGEVGVNETRPSAQMLINKTVGNDPIIFAATLRQTERCID
jgi:YVTN family beta-propeller protein